MSTVLFVKANDRPAEESVSVRMYEAFLKHYKETHAEDTVVEVHLHDQELPLLGWDMIQANYKSATGKELSGKEKQIRSIVEKHLEQFTSADKIVMAFPLWNLTVPSVLHAYLDLMHLPGKTFRYTEAGPVGLLSDKRAVLLNARGGVYGEDSPFEMAVHFVKRHLNFFGITNISTVVIEGHHQFPDQGASIIEEGMRKVVMEAKRF